jgi:hypothetical protein
MRTASWVLLAILGSFILLASLGSTSVAYHTSSTDQRVGGVTLKDVVAGRDEVETAMRGQRGTAAAFAAGFATLFLFVVVGPYRRGDAWSWWAILAGTAAYALLSMVRVVALGTWRGAAQAGIALAVVVVALLLDAGRLKSR